MTALDKPVDLPASTARDVVLPEPAGTRGMRTAGSDTTMASSGEVSVRRVHRRGLIAALLRFGVTGFLSVGLDVAILFELHSVAKVDLLLATTVAYASSLAVNYSLNHAWVFQADGQARRRLLRYGFLVVVNYTLVIGFVSGLTALGLYYLLARLIAVAVNALINFTAFRYWVFR